MDATMAPQAAAIPTIGSLRRQLVDRLRAGWGADGDHTTALDVRLILAHALGFEPGELSGREDEPVSAADVALASAMIDRRRQGEPVARIVGEKEFWSLSFLLSPATMVPRPDTETLVSTAVDTLAGSGRAGDSLRILDLGTGSGCILLAALSELPGAFGIGVDRDEEAVATATKNAERLGLSGRARFVAGDWAAAIRGPFDVILANPPYVEEEALPALPTEVIGYDPRLALAGGADGIDPYRAIVPDLPRLLAKTGFAVFEFGPRQGGPIAEIAVSTGMKTDIRRDLAGRERCALLTLS